LIINMR